MRKFLAPEVGSLVSAPIIAAISSVKKLRENGNASNSTTLRASYDQQSNRKAFTLH